MRLVYFSEFLSFANPPGKARVLPRLIKNGDIDLVTNTPSGKASVGGSRDIRRALLRQGTTYATTLSCARALASGIAALKKRELAVRSLQDYHRELSSSLTSPMPEPPRDAADVGS